jgi:hypothetical protein
LVEALHTPHERTQRSEPVQVPKLGPFHPAVDEPFLVLITTDVRVNDWQTRALRALLSSYWTL